MTRMVQIGTVYADVFCIVCAICVSYCINND